MNCVENCLRLIIQIKLSQCVITEFSFYYLFICIVFIGVAVYQQIFAFLPRIKVHDKENGKEFMMNTFEVKGIKRILYRYNYFFTLHRNEVF